MADFTLMILDVPIPDDYGQIDPLDQAIFGIKPAPI